MSDGEVNQALSLASSLGIPLEDLPWDVPDEVRTKGMMAILEYMMVRRTGSTIWHQQVFEQVFAIAEELGIATQDLPWDLESVSDYLDPYHSELANHQFNATYRKMGKVIPRDEIDVMLNKHLEPTGWTIDRWTKASEEKTRAYRARYEKRQKEIRQLRKLIREYYYLILT